MKLSEMPIDQLKQTPYFHLVSPEKLKTPGDFAYWLEAILHNACEVREENDEFFLIEIKQLVARVDGLKMEIYSDEDPPPHFHVLAPDVSAKFDIESCELLKGDISGRDIRKVRYWHKYAKPILIEAWDSTRPTYCTVGPYRGT